MFGAMVERDWGAGPACRTVIGAVETTATGNVMLRVGEETAPHGDEWCQIGIPIVLTQQEAVRLIARLATALAEAPSQLTHATSGPPASE